MRLLKAVLLVLLILSVVSFGGEAEANDTRNRGPFIFTENITTTVKMDRQLFPYDTGTKATTYVDDYSQTDTVQFTVTKNGIYSEDIILKDYFPVAPYMQYEYLLFGWYLHATPITESINGETCAKGYKFSTSLTPNSFYSLPEVPILRSGVYKEFGSGSDNIYYKFYTPTKGDFIGLNVYSGATNYRYARIEMAYSDGNLWQGFYTPADDPSITISNVTTNKATISWNTNNTNPAGTSYTLRYQVLKENGDPANESDWLPNGSPDSWPIIPIDNQNTTTALTTTAEVFQPDHTYRLTVQVNHIGGPQYNVYSDYVIFSTSADPAVRAAQEAAIAAQAAKKAAEETLQYSSDAKIAAENAQKTAETVLNQVNHSKYGLKALYNKIDLSILPDIRKVSNPKGATVAVNQKFDVKINATGIKENLRYRVYLW